MNNDYIESFLAIVNLQTISAAAEALFVSQSTLSTRLQQLEACVGTTLFRRERGMKKMLLTEDGKKFYPLALSWKELYRDMQQVHSATSLGKITIGSMDSINQYLLSSIIHTIRSDIPDLQMHFVSYHSQEIYSRLSSMQIDVGFAFYPVHYDITAVPVFSEPMYVITPPGSIYPDGPIHPSVLKKRDQVQFTWNDHIMNWNDEWWDPKEPPYVLVDSCALLTIFLTQPRNWALCPASVATSLQAMGMVEIHHLTERPPDRVCYLLQRRQSKSTPNLAAEVFVSRFNQLLETHPWRYSEKHN